MTTRFSRYISKGVGVEIFGSKQNGRVLGANSVWTGETDKRGFICRNDSSKNTTTTMVLSIMIANVVDDEIYVSLQLCNENETDPVYIAKSIPVPSGSTTIFGSEMKLIMQNGDYIKAFIDNGADATGDGTDTITVEDENGIPEIEATGTCDIILNIVEMNP